MSFFFFKKKKKIVYNCPAQEIHLASLCNSVKERPGGSEVTSLTSSLSAVHSSPVDSSPPSQSQFAYIYLFIFL